MRFSRLLAPTLREAPADAEIVSHQLLMRAGFIRRMAGGIYSYLPLAKRVLQKVEAIVRDEMNKSGAQELLMPIIQPAELWLESGRWQVYGDEMFRLKDRHKRDFCLGPTHEEMITTIVKNDVRSYRQLPINLYQIQNKYRDERRPRFGLMRGREFIMKDAYSFDRNAEGLQVHYDEMYAAYERIFSRCGLDFRPVEADSGAIGGSGSHEFMALAESGEAEIVYCDKCSYAANIEKAEAVEYVYNEPPTTDLVEMIATPNVRTIAEVAEFLGINSSQTVKALVYWADEKLIVAFVRGDHELNEIKLKNILNCLELRMADADEFMENIGCECGFIGPVDLNDKVITIADKTVMAMPNLVCGANKEGYHLRNVAPKRDFQVQMVTDLRLVGAGDCCPRCSGTLQLARGIEVGQVFKLGTKYSEKLGAYYLDENGREQVMVMGCYGIGVSRTMQAAVEQHNDKDGIVWPVAIAPYHVYLTPVNVKDDNQRTTIEQIYNELRTSGIEAVYDDRDERAGVKFKDADLIGFPYKIVAGPKSVAEGKVEVKVRNNGENMMLTATEAVEYIASKLKEAGVI